MCTTFGPLARYPGGAHCRLNDCLVPRRRKHLNFSWQGSPRLTHINAQRLCIEGTYNRYLLGSTAGTIRWGSNREANLSARAAKGERGSRISSIVGTLLVGSFANLSCLLSQECSCCLTQVLQRAIQIAAAASHVVARKSRAPPPALVVVVVVVTVRSVALVLMGWFLMARAGVNAAAGRTGMTAATGA